MEIFEYMCICTDLFLGKFIKEYNLYKNSQLLHLYGDQKRHLEAPTCGHACKQAS